MKTIKTGSISRLQVYEDCAYRAYLQYVLKIPTPDSPAMARGTVVHTEAEAFVRGATPTLAPELQHFAAEYTQLRNVAMTQPERVITEQMWCLDRDWAPVADDDWANIWLRVKLDHLFYLSPEEAVVADTKTGQVYPVKHKQQELLYCLAAVLRDPNIQRITGEMWYVDQDMLRRGSYSRTQIMCFWKGFNSRFLKMTDATEFPATPTSMTCKWCPYKKSGQCEFAFAG